MKEKTEEMAQMEAKIAGWKAKHGEVFMVEVDGKVAYLKKPDRKTISAATVVGQNDPIRFSEILLQNCWIEGDEQIKTDNELFFGVSAQLGQLMQAKEASLKKL